MPEPLHTMLKEAAYGDIGWLWTGDEWELVRVGDEFDGLTQIETLEECRSATEEDWDSPFVPVSEPGFELGDRDMPVPTHRIELVDGSASITRSWTSRSDIDDEKFRQLYAEIGKLIDKAMGR